MGLNLIELVLVHSRSKLGARLVLLTVAHQAADSRRRTQMSVADLAHRTGMSRRRVIASVRALERLGELSVEPGAGRYDPNWQTITLTPGAVPILRPFPADPAAVRRRALRGREMDRATWDRDGWECQARIDDGCTRHRYLTIGHVIPIADGGTDDLANLQTECQHCNTTKGAR